MATLDLRNIATGTRIPAENYCDQPYIVVTTDGNWLCVLTTGVGVEGQRGQHVVSTTSSDKGRTWSPLADIEPADGPEASWAMPLLTPSGRVYVFYNYNGDNLRELIADNDYSRHRLDTMGHFVMKYSDDNGRTWSKERYDIPMRLFEIDRANPYGGKVLFFWGIGKPVTVKDKVFLGMHKVGKLGETFIETSEGFWLASDNILTESDPARVRWETLPDGDVGLRPIKGKIAEENTLVGLRDGSLYTVWRTAEGHPCHAYSRDGGHTWTPPEYATYTPGGRRIKQPRACCRIHRFSNGKYVLWFHNNSHRSFWHRARNPVWLSGGIEKYGFIHWSQPEILLYGADREKGMSYPDWVEADGGYRVTETQKTVARIHEVDPALLEGMWNQWTEERLVKSGLVLALPAERTREARVDMPPLPDLSAGGGFTIDLDIAFKWFAPGQILLNTREDGGTGITVMTGERQTLMVYLSDGRTTERWESDAGLFQCDTPHHVSIIVDGLAKVLSFVVDGRLLDGGGDRLYGWLRFSDALGDVNGAKKATIAPAFEGRVLSLRIYDRYLRTSEAVANWRAGLADPRNRVPRTNEYLHYREG